MSAKKIFDRAKGKIPSRIRDKIRVRSPGSKTLEDLSDDSPRILFKCKAVFPFQLFPDQVIVDETKVTIIIARFIQTEQVRSVLIKDIANIQIQSSYLFSTVNVVDRHFITQPISVDYLWNKHAYKLRQIVMGLVIAIDNNVDLSAYSDEELIDHVQQIGSARGLEDTNTPLEEAQEDT